MEADLEKQARKIVVEKIKGAPNARDLVAEIVRTLVLPTSSRERPAQDPRSAIVATCRGVISGMFLVEKDLAEAAVSLLSQMSLVAQETHQDPAECMIWAMEGIAEAVKLAPQTASDAVVAAIAANFMGAGEIFIGLMRAGGGR